MVRASNTSGEEPIENAPSGYSQVLPVTQLPQDFDGVPQDGAQYLAAMQAQSRNLPWVTIAKDLYQPIDRLPRAEASNATAGSSKDSDLNKRHPALPSESWIVSFDNHFVAYRAYIASLPTPSISPEHASLVRVRDDVHWFSFINGSRRKKFYRKGSDASDREGNGDAKDDQSNDDAGEWNGEDFDEEEQMNGEVLRGTVAGVQVTVERTLFPGPDSNLASLRSKTDGQDGEYDEDGMEGEDEEDWVEDDNDENEDPDETTGGIDASSGANASSLAGRAGGGYYELEPEMEKHRAREPLMSFVKALPEHRQIFLIEAFTRWITASLSAHTDPAILVSTQPVSDPNEEDGTMYTHVPPPEDELPLPSHWAKWIFVLLCCISKELSGDQVYALRELAKVCRNIVKWQVNAGLLVQPIVDDVGGEVEIEKIKAQEAMRRDCWMIHEAVIAGWAQRDLAMDAEQIFAKMMASSKRS